MCFGFFCSLVGFWVVFYFFGMIFVWSLDIDNVASKMLCLVELSFSEALEI